MRQIEAYQCYDGQIFSDESKAKAHDEDLLGQELDGLLKLFGFGGKLTRNDEWRGLMNLMQNRKELRKSVDLIAAILAHGDEE
ncbi:hypothetical protein [Rhodoferax mekongensis]|uniref:Uncharacterized protein n=1 Tax=Rhodoferax mekongensis TaxID=3068341 RepID=A0ABZ0B2L2_9BURK|nr:hypothetical protein [Rhodoferax sp. TBRC 17307]WNO06027.1 hypothetical protein RAN89_06245 [Rhodoferax sp. TBRC 17307]